jgi:hypothetical protein
LQGAIEEMCVQMIKVIRRTTQHASFLPNIELWFLDGLKCPDCQIDLRGSDAKATMFGGADLICWKCHETVASFEPKSKVQR